MLLQDCCFLSPAFLFGAVLVFISQMYVLKESSGERYSAPFFSMSYVSWQVIILNVDCKS